MAVSQNVFQSAPTYEESLHRAASSMGIDRDYYDIFGNRHTVSADVERRLLSALGFDVSSHDAIEAERLRRFTSEASAVLPGTLVISASDRIAPVTLRAFPRDSLSFDIQLEDGNRLAASIDISQLAVRQEFVAANEHWTQYALALPPELPLGYHKLRVSINGSFAGEANLIICPERAYLPGSLANGGRTAGLNVTLYGLRSERNWGCGDFADLRRLIDWSANELKVSFIGLNPLHALHNRFPYNTSPYLPLSMFYKNFIYIDIESVPEFQSSSFAARLRNSPRLQQEIAQLRASEFVEYERVDRLKRRFLKVLFRQFQNEFRQGSARAAAFTAYCDREGDLLHKFALYCALDEILHKQDRTRWTWQHWPDQYHSPNSTASKQFAETHARTVRFYKYVQFVIEEQLSAAQSYTRNAGLNIGLYHDLALATDSFGSDLWAHRDFYVQGCRVGAPPDDFSPKGQDWAFPPPNSEAHRKDGYALYRESIRKIVTHGGALRIDHVMRLFRLFWIPSGVEAADGVYVRDNAIDLMRILALESVRSRNIIIGEDLGTVTDEMRDTLARFGILSYRLFYFEKHQDRTFKWSGEYPRQALVASTTHDLPTIAGFWTCRDIEARRAAGLADEQGYWSQKSDRNQEKQRMLDRLHAEQLLPADYPRDAAQIPEVDGLLHNAIIGFLSQVPSMLLLINQEDLTKETEQQNLPGSTAEYPNWRRKMKITLEELDTASGQGFAAMLRSQLDRTGRQNL